jgi:hypothetical protein
MNDQLTEKPSKTRRLTDVALILVAISAIATWLWRRRGADSAAPTALPPHEAAPISDQISSGVGSSTTSNP